MLFSIRKAAAANLETPQRAVDLLLACHTRIRRFARLASDLTVFPDAPAIDIADAARALVRYHRFALPLHEADEELSLLPRLEALQLSDAIRDEIAGITEGHRRVDAIIDELIRGWSALAEAPEQMPRLLPTLAPLSVALASLWEPHLAGEETIVFPALALLPPESERALLNEMRARRAASFEVPEGAAIRGAAALPGAR